MHRIFEIKENVRYLDRKGAYLIPINGKKVGVIQTYYSGKLIEQKQKPIEDDHRLVWIDYSELKGKMYLIIQNWALDMCWESKDIK